MEVLIGHTGHMKIRNKDIFLFRVSVKFAAMAWMILTMHLCNVPMERCNRVLTITWRVWFARHEVTHGKELPAVEGSKRSICSYMQSLQNGWRMTPELIAKGKHVMGLTVTTRQVSSPPIYRARILVAPTWRSPEAECGWSFRCPVFASGAPVWFYDVAVARSSSPLVEIYGNAPMSWKQKCKCAWKTFICSRHESGAYHDGIGLRGASTNGIRWISSRSYSGRPSYFTFF
jgi:hypothetical protein